MQMLSEPIILMLLPACLVFVGMFIGFVLWSWARGIDNQALEDLHDDIRRLGNRIKEQPAGTELADLQFENDELRAQGDTFAEQQLQLEQELTELKSQLNELEHENKMAKQTIDRMKERESLSVPYDAIQDQANEKDTQFDSMQVASENSMGYQFVPKPIFKPQLLANESANSETSEPTILRPVFGQSTSQFEEAASEANTPDLDLEYGGEVRRDTELGLVYSRPPIINDNLQLISGIASKLETQLNEYGVYTFQQIMLWDRHNIDQFSNLLDTFQDRIQRDDWVGQAKTLYNKAKSMRKSA